MSNAKSFAEKELEILIKTTPTAVIREFIPEIIALCDKFGNSGQSGGSAPFVAGALSTAIKNLCLFKPIAPLTGEEDEWIDVDGNIKQNKRLSSVFKNNDGKAYYLDAIVFQGPDEYDTFTGNVCGVKSRQYIKSFPFKQKTFYINVLRENWDDSKHNAKEWDKVECGPGPMAYKIKDQEQLKEVFEYYDEIK